MPRGNQSAMKNMNMAFVSASWHSDIVEVCRNSFVAAMDASGFTGTIENFEFPGALEIPLTAQWIAEAGKHDVILAAGLVVDGGIYRHDFVAETVISSMMDVQLKTGVPILSAVLTPHHFHEHNEHHSFFKNHMQTKGNELANACLKTLDNLKP